MYMRRCIGVDPTGKLLAPDDDVSLDSGLQREMGLFAPDSGIDGSLYDVVPSSGSSPEDIYAEEEEANQYLRLLTPSERAVLEQRFGNDQTCEESGLALGVSRSQAHRLECGAIEKMQAFAKKMAS